MAKQTIDAPAYGAQILSETYGRPFWEVWNSLPERIRRRHSAVKAEPEATADFFGLTDDDLIPWWTPERPLTWSEEMEEWFKNLRKRHEELTQRVDYDPFTIDEVLDLLEGIEERYRFVMCFRSFIEETLGNLKDPRIQACWQQIFEMANEPDPKKAACEAFPDLKYSILDRYLHPASAPYASFMQVFNSRLGIEKNIARVPLQRYLGLVGNKALRREVLGF